MSGRLERLLLKPRLNVVYRGEAEWSGGVSPPWYYDHL